MKTKLGLMLAAMLATGVLAQDATTPAPPAAAAPAVAAPLATPVAAEASAPTNKPAVKHAAKKHKKKPAAAVEAAKKPAEPQAGLAPAIPLVPNEPAVARQNNVNVRGKADINSEIIVRLKAGDEVTVLEEITLAHPKADEPARWAKIAFPTNAHVWVNASYLNAEMAVKPAKLNVRTGPGENYNVAGLLHKGDTVKELRTKGDWKEIEPPAGAFAFVAAHLLTAKPAAPAVVEATPPAPVATVPPVVTPPAIVPAPVPLAAAPVQAPPVVEVPKPAAAAPVVPAAPVEEPKPTIVEPPKPIATTPTDIVPTPPPATVPPVVTNPPPALVVAPSPVEPPVVPAPAVPAPLPPNTEEPAPTKRIVHREGIVRGTVSIQAPSVYQLEGLDNGNVINYLYPTSTNLYLKRFKGRTVIVTGEEGLDERWPNMPVLFVDQIQVVR